ncbi:MAG: antitoxin Xre-like helix-turn-helix domain-containing protein [Ginsengibacter sp.]
MEKHKKQKAEPVKLKYKWQPARTNAAPLPAKPAHMVKDFTYKEFKKIADKVLFTQKEWSELLHISERTLQRYAKENGTFTFNIIDRIVSIDKVIKKGTEVFGSSVKFISWLRSCPYMIEGRLSLLSLSDFEGINKILTQLGRIEQGLFT